MADKIIAPRCNFECEMIIEDQKVSDLYDESIALLIGNKYQFVSISDFKNKSGQTIGDFLLDKHENFVIALSKKERSI